MYIYSSITGSFNIQCNIYNNKEISFYWTIEQQEMFQKHKCPPWCKIQVYLLCRSKNCPQQVSMWLKYIKWTTHWAQKSYLTLTFKHVIWKSIGIIYLFSATPAPCLLLIKWRGQKIWYWADNTQGSKEWFDLDL